MSGGDRPFFDTSAIVDDLDLGYWHNFATAPPMSREGLVRVVADYRERIDRDRRRWAKASGSAAEPDCG